MTTTAQLITVLSHHIGRANGISAQALAATLGCPARQVRTLVMALRRGGTAVCGHPSSGYFIAANLEELDATCKWLRSRAMASLEQESTLRNQPMADLIGQLRLPT